MKKTFVFLLALCMLCACTKKKTAQGRISYSHELGILYGMTNDELGHLKHTYNIVVVNGAKTDPETVKSLHQKANYVYSYLDIGAISITNKKFSNFKSILTKPTVSGRKWYLKTNNKKWQKYIQKQASKMKRMGFDGYFVDHTNVYEISHNQATYNGLKTIVSHLKKEKKGIILHNAMSFVEKDQSILKNIDGISQEDVFTYWNHKDNKRENTNKVTSDNLKIYLNHMKDLHKNVYVIDFTKKSDWNAVIDAYCKKYDLTAIHPVSTAYDKEE